MTDGSAYDIELQEIGGANNTKLALAQRRLPGDRPGPKSWEIGRAEPFVPGFRTDPASPNHDPTDRMLFVQRDWQDGALISTWADVDGQRNGYHATSFDARWPNRLFRGVPRNIGQDRGNDGAPIGFLIANPFFESTADDGWTDLGTPTDTDLQSTTNPRTDLFGTQCARIIAASSGDGIKVTLANPTVYQGVQITASCYLDTDGGGARINITDSVGTTNGNTVTATSYTESTATRTIDAGATSVQIEIEGTAAGTFDVDDVRIVLGVANQTLSPTRIVVFEDGIYQAFGRAICKLDTGTTDQFKWDLVDALSTDVTDLIALNSSIYAALGASTTYRHSADGSTWQDASGAGTTNVLKWAVSKGKLWAQTDTNEIKESNTSGADPANADDWAGSGSATYTVGDNQVPITGLYEFNDTIWVAKEDGLWSFLRFYEDGTAANDFINQTPEFNTAQTSNTFSRAQEHLGWMYFKTSETGLSRTNGFRLNDVSGRIVKPCCDVGGRVRAFANDPLELFIFADDKLYSYRQEPDSPPKLHTLQGPSVSVDGSLQTGTVTDSSVDNLGGTVANDGGWANDSNVLAEANAATYTHAFDLAFPAETGLVKVAGADHTNWVGDTHTYVPTTSQVRTFGGSTDLWGTTWTPAGINDSGFGVVIGAGSVKSEINVRNFGFTIPTDATIDGIKVEQQDAGSTTLLSLLYVKVSVYWSFPPIQADAINVKDASVVPWQISSEDYLHLLGTATGLDSTDSRTYIFTDCWALPRAATPDLDATPYANSTDFIRSSIWDGGLPNVQKAGDSFTIATKGMTTAATITVKFGRDGASAEDQQLGTISSTTGNINTLYFNDLATPGANAVGKSWQFYIEVSGAPEDFQIDGFEFRCHASQVRQRQWTFDVQVGEAQLNNGQIDPTSKGALVTALLALEDSTFPIQLIEDLDRDGTITTTAVRFDQQSLQRLPDTDYVVGPNTEVWRLTLREAVDS